MKSTWHLLAGVAAAALATSGFAPRARSLDQADAEAVDEALEKPVGREHKR